MADASSPDPTLAETVLEDLLGTRDVLDGVILGPGGELAAGAPEMAGPARDLFDAAGDAEDLEVTAARRTVHGSRAGGYAIALVCRRPALASLVAYDLHMALGRLRSEGPGGA